ncbi:outer membrane protein [Alcanivorax hongdengensis A-11-3]|uniref:Outer membrane protein n=1 Tax=Alcanivorax hongdengensis A-11-3 TaxID=1177179 RepID=L0W861_9GAMM|nr:outer membrane beta-barrel protein [Alcanivorax hongdengensis]EKF73154.1 outer membrane protein [Alcanivorax hongdengensis A-11-3]
MKGSAQWLAAAAFLSVAPLANAGGIYIGGGLYNSAADEKVDQLNIDDDDTTGALFLGWRPIELIGVEAGYYDFGKLKADNSNASIEGGATTLAGLLSLELGPVGVYAKGGVADTSFDVKHGSDDNADSTDPFGGLGATVDLLDKLYVYGEYMHFDNDAKIDMLGVGLRYQF